MLDFSQVVQDASGLTPPGILPGEDERQDEPEVMTAVMVTQPLTLAAVRGQFSECLVRVQGMARDAIALTVDDEESLKFAVALGGEASKIAKRIDAKRKEVTADASDFVKSVNGFCKDYTDRLGEVVTITKTKVGQYQHQVELERRRQEEAARKAAQELQDKLRREAEEMNRKAREEAARQAEEEAKARFAKEAEERAKKEAESKAQEEARKIREAEEIEAAKKKAEEEAAKHEIQAPTVLAPVIPVQEKVTRTDTGASSYQVKTWKAEIISEADVPREFCSVDMKKINDAVKMGIRAVSGVRIYEETSTRYRT